MKGINLSGSVHALVLITQIHVQTGDCSPLNPCDELLSDGTGIIISTVFTALAKPTGWQHDFNMNNTACNTWHPYIDTYCWTHWCWCSCLGLRTWAAYHSAAKWSSSLHPLSILCLYTLSADPLLIPSALPSLLTCCVLTGETRGRESLMFIADQADAVKE